jgi:hypothetical protein
VEITCRVYRPRRPRESPLFRLVEHHLEELLRVWPERFARQRGPLRPVVERVLREVAFSCRGRSFCPSCEKKKQLLWAEWLRGQLLAPVSHRHVVLTIPRPLRPLFRRRHGMESEEGWIRGCSC